MITTSFLKNVILFTLIIGGALGALYVYDRYFSGDDPVLFESSSSIDIER